MNPAFEAIKLLPDTIAGAEIVKVEIPTEFTRSISCVEAAIKEHNPDVVIDIGQAGGRACVTVEKVGINLADARIPDNAGEQPSDEPLQADGPTAYFATIPVKAMVQNVREHGLPCHVSFTAGTYVCNCVMYNVLHLCATKYPNIRAGFIHVPFACEQVVGKASTMQACRWKRLQNLWNTASSSRNQQRRSKRGNGNDPLKKHFRPSYRKKVRRPIFFAFFPFANHIFCVTIDFVRIFMRKERKKMEQGKIFKFHNDLDTDQIIASQYLLLPNLDEMKGHAFESLDPDFAKKVKPGDFVVGGENFGCGSSREQAPGVLKALGVQAVIAKSFARIFFRNAINIGLPAIVCKDLPDAVENGDTMILHMSEGTAEVNGKTYTCTKLPEYMQNILNQGGLIASLNREEE